MIETKIGRHLHNLLPTSRLGLLSSNVKVEPSTPAFQDFLDQNHQILINSLGSKRETAFEVIQETRSAYKICGKEPSRYRPSAEALLRRLRTKRALYQINNVVDSINHISMNSKFSIGGFDLLKIQGEIICEIGSSDKYEAIGRGDLNIEFMPGLRDDNGFFGTPTSDSVRTMVTNDTKQLLLVFYDFYENSALEDSINYAAEILEKYCFGYNMESKIIRRHIQE